MIYGLNATDLPKGYIALDAVAVVKALNELGEPELLIRSTSTLSDWECLGMLDAAHATCKEEFVATFEVEDDDDEQDEG